MDLKLTEEQRQIRRLVKEFCQREIDMKRINEIEDRVSMAETCEEVTAVFPWDLLEKLHDVGLRQLAVPRKYGGTAPESGDYYVTQLIATEEMGYHAGPVAGLLGNLYTYCSAPAHNPDEEQKAKFFADFMNNTRQFPAGTVSEPEGGTDPHIPYDEPGGTLKTFAYKDGDEWVINGNKMFCTGGAAADVIMVVCRTDKNGLLTRSLTAFYVPTGAPGVTRYLNRFVIAELGGNVQTYLDNVRVPEISMLGKVNKGYTMIHAAMAYKWMLLAGYLGEIRRMYDEVRTYARERLQGGKPIIQHSMVAAKLGEAGIDIEALRAFTYRLAWETDQKENHRVPLNVFWGQGYLNLMKRTGWRLAETANDVYGGIAKSVDLPLERFTRRMFLIASAGTPTGINAYKAGLDYDGRYNWQFEG